MVDNIYPKQNLMHIALIGLLKKKNVYEDMIKELAIKYGLADVDIQEFYEIYP
jgi:hypothetical protein